MKNFIDKLFKGIDYLTGILTGLMVLFVFLNVVMRTFFNSGLTWSEELSRYLFVFVTYVGAISAMHANAHIGVDTLLSRVPVKIQLLFYTIAQAAITVIMGILVHGSVKMVIQNTASKTAALGIPYSVLYSVGIICGLGIGVLAIANIIYALTHPNEIGSIVTTHSEDDEIIAEAKKAEAEIEG